MVCLPTPLNTKGNRCLVIWHLGSWNAFLLVTFRAYIEFEKPPGMEQQSNAIFPGVYKAIKMRWDSKCQLLKDYTCKATSNELMLHDYCTFQGDMLEQYILECEQSLSSPKVCNPSSFNFLHVICIIWRSLCACDPRKKLLLVAV